MYVMYALQEIDHVLALRTVGIFESFKDFLEAYPKIKRFYGAELICRYQSTWETIDGDDFTEFDL